MNCGEPKPGGIYETCDKDLRHSDDHAYLNQRWPRPVPAEPNWNVNELLQAATPRNAWGIEDRSFPIIVVETTTKVIWVDAEDEDQALAHYGDDWSDIPLQDADVIGGDLELRRPEQWERQDALASRGYGRTIGPQIACPGCGKLAFRRAWFHNPMRKCHGPIKWLENTTTKPQWRYQRKFDATPVYDAACQVVAS